MRGFVYCARERGSARERNEKSREIETTEGVERRGHAEGGDEAVRGWVENDDHHTQSGT
jgi:hypothetical protein